jgi:hypothetical protein
MIVMAVAGFVATLFLKEIPLRTTIASPEKSESAATPEPIAPLAVE